MGDTVTTLFIDTATPLCAVALHHDGATTLRVLDDNRRHVEVLTPGISELLRDHHITPRELTRVVVDRGPGLYTGLRVGVATAVALADGVGCDVVGVTSLELLAHGAYADGVRGKFLSLVDGRRSEVFAQSFELDTSVRPTSEPTVRTPNDIVVEYGTSGAPTTFGGDGATKYAELFSLMSWIRVATPSESWLTVGPSLGAERVVTPIELLYLREPDAVANFTTRSS